MRSAQEEFGGYPPAVFAYPLYVFRSDSIFVWPMNTTSIEM